MLFVPQKPPLPLVPLPASIRRDAGALPLDRPLLVSGPKDEAATLSDALKLDGIAVGRGGRRITMRTVPGMAAEGYRLTVDPSGATIEATTKAGLFYGGQTLRQLARGAEIPAVTIEDAPRFAWRGMHLDVSRHFRTIADVERIIDLNARMKMNVFHWHLTDDGGWRMESKAYPELTRRGAWRSAPQKGKWRYSGIVFPESRKGDEYGGFYTQEEIKKVVAYAARRHVIVVPEIEMPGHEQAALQSLPWLKCDAAPEGQEAVALCAGKPTTMAFVRRILDETMTLFPSKWIHIGGDEVEKRDWLRCPRCQARMREEGLKTPQELQSSFTREVDAYLAAKGRRMIGWDEILEGGLTQKPISTGATVMSWRGVAGGIAAAKQGHDVVMSPTSHLYLDYAYETIPTEKVYAYDPIPPELTPEEGRHVLGAQGNVWTEWLPDQKDVERMAYPRIAALAEVAWTPLAQKSWPDFAFRMEAQRDRWDSLGVAYRLDPPSVGPTAYLGVEVVNLRFPEGMWGRRSFRMEPHDRITTTDQGHAYALVGTDVTYTLTRATDGATSQTVVRSSRGDRRETVEGLSAGLLASGVPGRFDRVAPFSGPAGSVVTGVDLAAKPAPEAFAMRFTGFIRLPKDGEYAFDLASDDGSILSIGGLTIVDHDGEHTATAKKGAVWAKAGVYPFEVRYFDAGGANSLSLSVTPPGGLEGSIPADWLWH